jgi:hypothetical protein
MLDKAKAIRIDIGGTPSTSVAIIAPMPPVARDSQMER